MTWPPSTESAQRAAQRRQLQVADALDFIETFAPAPKPRPPLDPAAWAKQLELKAEALAFIETFKPRPRKRRWMKVHR